MRPEKNKKTPQKVRYSFLKILTGSDLSRRRLPFMSVESVNAGPVVWLTACIHGDEVTGMVTIQEVFKRIQRQRLLRGSVYAFPLMNPIGFDTASRYITLSREDLNKSFPGSENGSLAERIADRILGTIKGTKPSLVVDLHNDWMKSIPYTVVDIDPGPGGKKAYEQAKAIAQKTGFLVVAETEQSAKSLSYTLLRDNIPALTLELGESYVVNEQNVKYGLNAIEGILRYLGMVEAADELPHYEIPETLKGKTLSFSSEPASSGSGIIRFSGAPGDIVKRGQVVAKIYNAFGKLLDTIRCSNDGVILGHSDSSVAFPGAPVMAFGII
ncbi:MAG: succinylglutamate desuccinylase/aspartoacylase family protein [Sedimentisphaerales bacterium]|nr:succinylglutamate desuccinylase/aspartoacylase family protein [Sedimentisphaerales bacterium]